MINYFVVNKNYSDIASIYDVTNYVMRDKRYKEYRMNRYSGGMHIYDIAHSGDEFLEVKRYFGKLFGRQVKHFYVTFDSKDNVDPLTEYHIGLLICQYYASRYQIVFSVHEDTDYPHIHFAVNTVSFVNGAKLHEGYQEFYALRNYCIRCYDKVVHKI